MDDKDIERAHQIQAEAAMVAVTNNLPRKHDPEQEKKDQAMKAAIKKYGSFDAIPPQEQKRLVDGVLSPEAAKRMVRHMLLISAVGLTAERFGLHMETSPYLQNAWGKLFRNEFREPKDILRVEDVTQSETPRRLVFEHLREDGEVTDSMLAALFPTEKTRQELDAWLDERIFDRIKEDSDE